MPRACDQTKAAASVIDAVSRPLAFLTRVRSRRDKTPYIGPATAQPANKTGHRAREENHVD